MKILAVIDSVPLSILFAGVVLLVLVSVEAGYRLGKHQRSRSNKEKEAPVSAMVGATLGLLAFLLAFTFGLAASRFDARRQILLDEANAIGTCYLRAEMLPERGEEMRTLLRKYVDVRLEAVRAPRLVGEGIVKSEQIQRQLWAYAVEVAKTSPNLFVSLFVQSLNEVIDLHAVRIQAGIRSRIPGSCWMALFALAALAFSGLGYHSGLSGTSRSLAILGVAIAFSMVIWLIADLDRAWEGTMVVSQQALIDLQQSMAVQAK